MLDRTNRNLTRLNPLKIPRDPKPARDAARRGTVVTSCYLIGDATPFLQIIQPPQPGCSRWSEKQRLLAEHFGCDRDDVGSLELADGSEAILVGSNIVGSFDRPIELRQLLAESAAALTDGSR